MNFKISDVYNFFCTKDSDINEHLPTLKNYASNCDLVVEMGVRWIVSTWAFLNAKPKKLISIDINHPSSCGGNLGLVEKLAKEENIDFQFIQADTTKIEIPECDFLFIDTWHVYDQLKKELQLHGNKAKKYIAFHDTVTFGTVGETAGYKGLNLAINEFLNENKNWQIEKIYENNNGLTIIKRVD